MRLYTIGRPCKEKRESGGGKGRELTGFLPFIHLYLLLKKKRKRDKMRNSLDSERRGEGREI